MNVIAYWKSRNYYSDLEHGYGFNFNSNRSTLHNRLGIGERLWLVGNEPRDGRNIYKLRGYLVVADQFENEPGHKYGRYGVDGDEDLSVYFADDGPDASELLLRLRFESNRPIQARELIGNSLQSPRVLTDNDDRILFDWADRNLTKLIPVFDGFEYQLIKDSASEFEQEIEHVDEGAGRVSSVEERLAIENHAMSVATAHYVSLGWDVEDASRRNPFDLRCTYGDGTEIHVEVKGTKTDGSRITLTSGEVSHARQRGSSGVDLFVVANIEIVVEPGGVIAFGGKKLLYSGWDVDADALIARQYECVLSGTPELDEIVED